MILLDTHVAVMLALDPERLSKPAAKAIARAVSLDGLAVASITLWEIAMLIARGEIVVPGSADAFLRQFADRPGLTILDLTPEIAVLSTHVPPEFPKDPADRIIAGTARANGLPLVTRDQRLQDSPLLKTIW